MKYNEIFANMSPELGERILMFLREDQREAYKQVVGGLATKRKLRPVFVQRKPLPKQLEWLLTSLRLPLSNEIGEQVISLYFMQGQQAMLIQFLDDLGIEHEEGTIEDLPETLEGEKIKAAMDRLFEAFPDEEVALYLQIFAFQSDGDYPELDEIIANDPRCKTAHSEG